MALVVQTGSAVSVGANAKSAEQVAGTYQFIGPGTIILVARASATGLNNTLVVGGVPLINDQVIPFTGTAGGISVKDNVCTAQRTLGGKVEYNMRNTTGAAITNDYIIFYEGA